jgi:hypothetical protein
MIALFIDHRRAMIDWYRSYLSYLFWRKLSLWLSSMRRSYYLPHASCQVSKGGSIASRTRREPTHYYSLTRCSPRPTPRLPLSCLAEAPSPLWSKRSQGASACLISIRFSSALQGAWPPLVPPNIDPKLPDHPPPANHSNTGRTNIPRHSQWSKPVDRVHLGRVQGDSRSTRIVRFRSVLTAVDTWVLSSLFGFTARLLASPLHSYERTSGIISSHRRKLTFRGRRGRLSG